MSSRLKMGNGRSRRSTTVTLPPAARAPSIATFSTLLLYECLRRLPANARILGIDLSGFLQFLLLQRFDLFHATFVPAAFKFCREPCGQDLLYFLGRRKSRR